MPPDPRKCTITFSLEFSFVMLCAHKRIQSVFSIVAFYSNISRRTECVTPEIFFLNRHTFLSKRPNIFFPLICFAT